MPPKPELTKASLLVFITLWFEEFGEILSEAEARIEAEKRLELYAMLCQPLPGEEEEKRP